MTMSDHAKPGHHAKAAADAVKLLDAATEGDLGTFDPKEHAGTANVPPYTIPALAAFRDNPTRETHMEAAKLIHKCGELCLDGRVYKLVEGKVVSFVPRRNPHEIMADDPKDMP